MNTLEKILNAGPSRRSFLAGVGAAGAAAVVVGCGSSSVTTTTPSPTNAPPSSVTDFDILNFALNLEYLEAEFYLLAATGSGVPTAYLGANPGAVTGGAQVPFTADQAVLQQYANEIAQDELNHVIFLRSAITSLGGTPVDRPAIDFAASFPGLATLAGISSSFNPFADPYQFLVGAFVFEDVGVTAYHGAAPLITDKVNVLPAAASILAVEAYHAAEVRVLIAGMAAQAGASQTYLNDANAIEAVRAAVGGGNETTLSTSSIVAAGPSSIAYERTTDQVLHIVYASGPGVVSKGGFFPNGLNGTITATTT